MGFQQIVSILDDAVGGPNAGVLRHGPFWRNHFRLEEANHRLGEGIEAPICQERHFAAGQAAVVRAARNR